METTILAAGEFKATCLKLMDEVASTGKSITITKRGKPLARLVPMSEAAERGVPLFGALTHCTRVTGDIMTPVIWRHDPVQKWKRIEHEATAHRKKAGKGSLRKPERSALA